MLNNKYWLQLCKSFTGTHLTNVCLWILKVGHLQWSEFPKSELCHPIPKVHIKADDVRRVSWERASTRDTCNCVFTWHTSTSHYSRSLTVSQLHPPASLCMTSSITTSSYLPVLTISTIGRLFWTWYEPSGSVTCREFIDYLEELLASQKGHWYM